MLRLKRSNEVPLSQNELCRSVALRLARVNHELDEEGILRKSKRAVKVLRNV